MTERLLSVLGCQTCIRH